MSSDNIYDTKTICYHWISAAIILTLWVVGQNIDSFEKGDPRVIVRSIHITLGLILALVFVIRVNWRIRGGVKLPQPDGVQGKKHRGLIICCTLLWALLFS
jgi:cytochrome b561